MFRFRVNALASRLSLTIAGTALVLMSVAGPSHATLTPVSSRPALSGNDFIDWGILGPAFTNVSNPFGINSNNGLPVTVHQQGQSGFQRRDQSTGGWAGNFAPGDTLLWTNGANGPITLDFASPIFGAGTQIQTDFFGLFSGVLSAYDSSSALLGSVPFSGNSTSAGDGSAIFVGVLSDSQNISKLVYDVQLATSSPTDFAINRTDLATTGNVSPTPEPCTLALLATGGGPMLLALRRRKLKQSD
jgi:hypothetical protein